MVAAFTGKRTYPSSGKKNMKEMTEEVQGTVIKIKNFHIRGKKKAKAYVSNGGNYSGLV